MQLEKMQQVADHTGSVTTMSFLRNANARFLAEFESTRNCWQ